MPNDDVYVFLWLDIYGPPFNPSTYTPRESSLLLNKLLGTDGTTISWTGCLDRKLKQPHVSCNRATDLTLLVLPVLPAFLLNIILNFGYMMFSISVWQGKKVPTY